MNDNIAHHEYVVGDLLGQGGFGRVFSGQRKPDNLEVVIKEVKKDSRYWRDNAANNNNNALPLETRQPGGGDQGGQEGQQVLEGQCSQQQQHLLAPGDPADAPSSERARLCQDPGLFR